MEKMTDAKRRELFEKTIDFKKDAMGNWYGSVKLADGSSQGVTAAPDMKMREAKAYIKESLWANANHYAIMRGTELVLKK